MISYELEEITRFFRKIPAFQELTKDQLHHLSKKALITYFQPTFNLLEPGSLYPAGNASVAPILIHPEDRISSSQ